jgi:hypothetical protein
MRMLDAEVQMTDRRRVFPLRRSKTVMRHSE